MLVTLWCTWYLLNIRTWSLLLLLFHLTPFPCIIITLRTRAKIREKGIQREICGRNVTSLLGSLEGPGLKSKRGIRNVFTWTWCFGKVFVGIWETLGNAKLVEKNSL